MNATYLLGFGVVLLAMMAGSGVALLKYARNEERLRERLQMANGTFVGSAGHRAKPARTLGATLARLVSAIGARIVGSGLLSRKTIEELERTLQTSGVSGRSAVGLFIGCKLLLVLALPAIALLATSGMELDPTLSNLIPGAAGVLGLVGPDMVIRRVRDRYVKKVEAGIPDALDMLLICTQAGLPLEPAILRVAAEIRLAHPQISWEMSQTANELQINSDSRVALTNFGDRTGLESIKRLGTTLIQTIQYGTPLSDALRTLSGEMRDETLLRFEERAARLPVLLTMPMVGFILPCLFIVVAGPAGLRLAAAFQ